MQEAALVLDREAIVCQNLSFISAQMLKCVYFCQKSTVIRAVWGLFATGMTNERSEISGEGLRLSGVDMIKSGLLWSETGDHITSPYGGGTGIEQGGAVANIADTIKKGKVATEIIREVAAVADECARIETSSSLIALKCVENSKSCGAGLGG